MSPFFQRARLPVLLVFPLTFTALIGHLWHLHTDENSTSYFKRHSQFERTIEKDIKAKRGEIVDANGDPLARNTPLFEVAVDTIQLRDAESAWVARQIRRTVSRDKSLRPEDAAKKAWTEIFAQREKDAETLAMLLCVPRENVRAALAPFTPKNKTPRTIEPMPASPFSPLPALLDDVFSKLRFHWREILKKQILSRDFYDTVSDPAGEAQHRQDAVIARRVSKEIAERIEAQKIRGVRVREYFVREYPFGRLAAHIVGHVDADGRGVQGVERQYDEALRGFNGYIKTERNGRPDGALLNPRSINVPAIDGVRIQLSLDRRVQQAVEEEADALVARYNPQSVIIIVSEPSTGKLLALTNRPTFDLAHAAEGESVLAPPQDRTNLALTAPQEPGSVFKVISVAMALNERMLDLADRFYCGRRREKFPVIYRGGKRPIALPGDTHTVNDKFPTAGTADIAGILQESSNNGAALVAMYVTARHPRHELLLHDYALRFGFGKRTNLPVALGSAESIGQGWAFWKTNAAGKSVPDNRALAQHFRHNISRLPMGQAVSATALQIHQAMCVVANGGKLMRSQLVLKTTAAPGAKDNNYTWTPDAGTAALRPEVAREIALMLRGVCMKGGTATGAELPGYEVAGKTGTAQKTVNGKPSNEHHVGSFSGFFPAEKPRIAITVIVDDAAKGTTKFGITYGGEVAAPAFKNIAAKVAEILKIPPAQPTHAILAAERRDGFVPPAILPDAKNPWPPNRVPRQPQNENTTAQ
jgi:cell division protein FtsI/penicillin-binding protein 2